MISMVGVYYWVALTLYASSQRLLHVTIEVICLMKKLGFQALGDLDHCGIHNRHA